MEFSCSEFYSSYNYGRERFCFFHFLELPFKFIKRYVELARKVVMSVFHEPSISAQNKITTHLKCYKNSSHLLDYGCTDSEINIVLMKHTECCTPDDFRKTLHLNYASHRLYTFFSKMNNPVKQFITTAWLRADFTFATLIC
jgi:hypothetical protein